jgi:dihydroorotate dehydrogenase (NAD+) catalytic subunit
MANQTQKFNDHIGFYNPRKTFEENFINGPFPGKDFKDYIDTGDPIYSFLGHKIYSPFGIPAGSLPTSRHIKLAFDAGFDVNVYKTMRSVDFEVNPYPNIVYVDAGSKLTLEETEKGLLGSENQFNDLRHTSITNSFGNPGKGPDYWIDDLKKAMTYEKKGQLLIMGVVGTIKPGFNDNDYFDDFAETAKLAASTGVKAIEVNLSCPNVASEGVLCYNKEADLEIARRCKKAIGDIPMILKLGYFSDSQQNLLEDIIKDIAPYASAISAINTIPAAVVDELGNQLLPGPGRLKAGICGASIKWAGVDMVARLDKIRKKLGYDYEIIGVGGVMSAHDFHEYRRAGADLVHSATGSMWNLNLAAEIKASL